MKQIFDLSNMDWTLTGHIPNLWKFSRLCPMSETPPVDVASIPARVPGSVQMSLRDAGILPDWNVGTNARACEWVENRHWIYRMSIPDAWLDGESTVRLNCLGLDYCGWIYVNNVEAGQFKGTHIPHVLDITSLLKEKDNVLEIIFGLPPRWLGQFGCTSQMKEWKPRFNYTWDWAVRVVQVGIWDAITLEITDGNDIADFYCEADADVDSQTGILNLRGTVHGDSDNIIRVRMERDTKIIRSEEFSIQEFSRGIQWNKLPIDLWWPNLEGSQPLYTVVCQLVNRSGIQQDSTCKRVGFRNVRWIPCEGAPKEADPWVCVVNGRPIFLQGVNFAPICANYADLKYEDYEKLLRTYYDLGCNMLRINACGFLEKSCFYDLCDELGLLIWQDFPLTSSGIDNWPPEDAESISQMAEIAASWVRRRQHHASLVLWCGGNELQGDMAGNKTGMGKPCSPDHPMLKRLKEVVYELDPSRRYVHTSPSGANWDEHGPYINCDPKELQQFWSEDVAIFRSELCCPGANPVEQIEKHADGMPIFPATADSPFWSRPTPWWIDWDRLVTAHGREPQDLTEYVAWSQENQAESLCDGTRACKARFPRCGGVLLWTGHDTFPIPINTSILDYFGNPKPAAMALSKIWRNKNK